LESSKVDKHVDEEKWLAPHNKQSKLMKRFMDIYRINKENGREKT